MEVPVAFLIPGYALEGPVKSGCWICICRYSSETKKKLADRRKSEKHVEMI